MTINNLYPLLLLFTYEDSEILAIFVSFCKYRMTRDVLDNIYIIAKNYVGQDKISSWARKIHCRGRPMCLPERKCFPLLGCGCLYLYLLDCICDSCRPTPPLRRCLCLYCPWPTPCIGGVGGQHSRLLQVTGKHRHPQPKCRNIYILTFLSGVPLR